MATKKILILGGGYGGVWAGKILEKHFRKREDVEITLVDKRPFHTLMTELHEVAGWRTEPESVQVLFKKIFGAKRINVVLDTIEKVDFEAKKATGKVQTYAFDYIILGVGAEPEFFGIPGIGYESIHSILARDYPVIQAVALLVATIFITVNLIVDTLYAWIDPRVRYEAAR